LGIVTRRTGIGRYVFETRSMGERSDAVLRRLWRSAANHPSRPAASIVSNPVHARRAVVLTSERIGVFENVRPMDLVVEQVEAVGGLRLRLAIELPLKAADLIRRCKAHRQSPSTPVFLG
jgi:hypothetical protein